MSDAKEFKNEHLTVSLLEEPGCMVKLDISVSPEATKAAFLKALKSVNKEVSIPGFRKGRAPNDLVLSHYKKYVEEEWKDVVLNTAFSEAIELIEKRPHNARAVKKPHVKSVSKEEGTQFTIEFETTPTVPDLDLSDFTLPEVSKQQVSEESVNEFIEELRLKMSEWETIEDRAVEDGDYVDLDIESLDDPDFMICEDTRFFISNKTAKWLHNLVIGATPGAVLEGVSEKEPHEHACDSSCTENHEHDEFTPTRCRITVKAIKKPIKPEIDDEFAKKIAAGSLEKLFENARSKLEKDAEEEKNHKIKEDLKKQIELKYLFDIPRSFLTSKNSEELTQLRLFFLAKEFAAKHNIQVTNNDVYRAAMHEVMTKGQYADELLHGNEETTDSIRAILYTNILIERALDKLLHLLTENSSR